MPGRARVGLSALVLLLSWSGTARAEWQLKPFIGVTFGGGTSLLNDVEQAVGKPNIAFGFTGGLLGEVFGIEADVAHAPGFFQSGSSHLVLASGLTMLTVNATVGLPRRMTEYTLRPYFVGGAGIVHPTINNFAGVFNYSSVLAAIDLGGGVTGFVNRARDIGISWEVRRFRTIHGPAPRGFSVGIEELSFWRANMALAIRY